MKYMNIIPDESINKMITRSRLTQFILELLTTFEHRRRHNIMMQTIPLKRKRKMKVGWRIVVKNDKEKRKIRY